MFSIALSFFFLVSSSRKKNSLLSNVYKMLMLLGNYMRTCYYRWSKAFSRHCPRVYLQPNYSYSPLSLFYSLLSSKGIVLYFYISGCNQPICPLENFSSLKPRWNGDSVSPLSLLPLKISKLMDFIDDH